MESFNVLNLLDKMTTINIKRTIIMNTASRVYRLFPNSEHIASVPSTNKLPFLNPISVPPRNLRTNPKNCIKHALGKQMMQPAGYYRRDSGLLHS